MDNSVVKGRVVVFGCGGAGVNIASSLGSSKYNDEIGFATLDPIYIDTSRSNLDKSLDDSKIYLIDDVDGSGQVRKENAREINNRIRPIIQQFKPADLNIVVSSAAGGK